MKLVLKNITDHLFYEGCCLSNHGTYKMSKKKNYTNTFVKSVEITTLHRQENFAWECVQEGQEVVWKEFTDAVSSSSCPRRKQRQSGTAYTPLKEE